MKCRASLSAQLSSQIESIALVTGLEFIQQQYKLILINLREPYHLAINSPQTPFDIYLISLQELIRVKYQRNTPLIQELIQELIFLP